MNDYIKRDKVLKELHLNHKDVIYIDKRDTAKRIEKIQGIDLDDYVPKDFHDKTCEAMAKAHQEEIAEMARVVRCKECKKCYKDTDALTKQTVLICQKHKYEFDWEKVEAEMVVDDEPTMEEWEELQDWKDRMWAEAVIEPQTITIEGKMSLNEWRKICPENPQFKDEPQTEVKVEPEVDCSWK